MNHFLVPLIVAALLPLPVDATGPRAFRPEGSLPPLSPAEEHEIYCRACALFDRGALPADSPYLLDRAICGTPVVMSLALNWPRLSKGTREAFASLFQRPSRQRTVTEGQFKIHFDESGRDAVSLTDRDSNGVPDYVDEVATTFEAVWDLQIDQLGYDPPLSDGDDFFDVYITELAPENTYGWAWPEPSAGTTAACYLEIDNDYREDIYASRGLDGLRVTVAHEFFHAVQFAYFSDMTSAGWWHEMTAVWMEDVAYDDVNDYYESIPFFFESPTASLDGDNKLASYSILGAAVFVHHLDRVFGRSSIRKTWEVLKSRDRSPYPESLGDLNAGLPLAGFRDVLPRFGVWNYLTGSRRRSGYYPEAASYPLVRTRTVRPAPGTPVSETSEVDHLGMEFVRVPTGRLSGGVRASFILDADATWTLLVLLVRDAGVELLRPRDPTRTEIPRIDRFNEIVFVPIVTSLRGSRFDLDYRIALDSGISVASDFVGDLDQDGQVYFSDFVKFADAFGKGADSPGYDEAADLDGNGKTNFTDFLIFVLHFGEPG